ncbi:MAG: helix-turn-helix transcriptional regulator [Bacillota bacterium]
MCSDDGCREQHCSCPETRMRHFIQPCLLLLLREKPSHGYELMANLPTVGFRETIDPGAVYRALRRLETEGFVTSDWETGTSGPARRLYTTTDEGIAYLDTWADHLKTVQERLDLFFSHYHSSGGDRQ